MRYLIPTAPIAADAILPADPGDALAIAQDVLEAPLMSNHNHGLWGYHGNTAAGRALTVQSTGIGGPSATAVLAELAELGVRRAVRVGACVALDPALAPGALIVVDRALAGDGASAALGAGDAVAPAPELAAALARAGGGALTAAIATRDVLDPGPADGAVALDLESAALLAAGKTHGVAVAAVVFVAPADGVAAPGSEPALRAARAALEALAADG